MSGDFTITPRAEMLMELLAEEFERCGYGDYYITPSFENGKPTFIWIALDAGGKEHVFATVVDGKWHVGTSLGESGAEDDDS